MTVCSGDMLQTCLEFLESSEEPTAQCEPIFLGPDVGFVNVMVYNDADGSCEIDMAELENVCQQFLAECLAFLESSEPTTPECEQVFLGQDIGYAHVMEYNDSDGTCQISMTELAAVCQDLLEECVAFLESSEGPQCEDVFLGPEIGYVHIMEYSDADGTCEISMEELAAVCTGDLFQTCLDFLESSESTTPQCDPVFLGPDIGFANVMLYNDVDGSCEISIAELSVVCSQFFDECMAFLESAQPQCEDVFLGPDVGYVHIMVYNDADGTCELSMDELAIVCTGDLYQTCLDFLESSDEPQPQCEDVFLGPELGYVHIMEYNDVDGTCEISMEELAAVCSGAMFETCLDFLASSEQAPQCAPVYLGPKLGFQNLLVYHDADGSCELDIEELAIVCSGDLFQTCVDFLESAEVSECEQVFLGPDIGFADVFTYSDEDATCELSMERLEAVCQGMFDECVAFLEASEVAAPQCEDVFLGPDVGYVHIMVYNDVDGTCELSMDE